jgi:spermidine synthase
MRNRHFKMLIRTFVDVFPDASVWFYEQSALLLGRKEPREFSFEELALRSELPRVAEDLAVAGMPSVSAVLGGFVTADDDLVEWLGEGPVMTDDLPIMEFYPLPRSTVTTFAADNLGSLREALRFPGDFLRFEGPSADEDRERLRSWTRSTGDVMSGMARRALRNYLALTGRSEEGAANLYEALRLFASALEVEPANRQAEWHLREARTTLLLSDAATALASGDVAKARASARRAIELSPDRMEGYYYLGIAEWTAGRGDPATKAFLEAQRRYPRHAASLWYLALLAAEAGNRDEAARYLRRARRIDPVGPLPDRLRARLIGPHGTE